MNDTGGALLTVVLSSVFFQFFPPLFAGPVHRVLRTSRPGTTPDKARNEAGYAFPRFLPDGRHFLVEVGTPGNQPNYIGVGSLDSKAVTHLAQITSQAVYAAPGDVLYVDQSTLMAQPFSASALRFTGPAIPVAQNIGSFNAYMFFSVSPAGPAGIPDHAWLGHQ